MVYLYIDFLFFDTVHKIFQPIIVHILENISVYVLISFFRYKLNMEDYDVMMQILQILSLPVDFYMSISVSEKKAPNACKAIDFISLTSVHFVIQYKS